MSVGRTIPMDMADCNTVHHSKAECCANARLMLALIRSVAHGSRPTVKEAEEARALLAWIEGERT